MKINQNRKFFLSENSIFRKDFTSKILIALLLLWTLTLISNEKVNGQSCSAGGCFSFTNQYPNGIFSTSSTSWSVIQSTAGDALFNAGNYTKFNVVEGNTYEWSYCEQYGGFSTSWDAQMTLFNENNLSTPICYSTDECGTNNNAPYLRWLANFTGTVRILTTMFSGTSCLTNTGSARNKMVWRLASSCTPVSLSNPNLPQDVTVIEGASATFTVSANGTPPFSYFWYKNGVFTGTRTTNTSNTTNQYTTPALSASDDGSTYYCLIQNCNQQNQVQSNTATVHVTASCTPPSAPPNPTSNTPTCGAVTLVRQGSVPANVTWYWQGTSCGTRMDLGSSNTYLATTSGTYFIRAYNNNTNCWSAGCGSVSVTVTPGPTVTANSNSPVTAPAPLNLTATTISGASYTWTGPNGYSASIQNPVRNPTNESMSGQYCVIALAGACTSNQACSDIVINAAPQPTINTITFTNYIDSHPQIPNPNILYSGSPYSTGQPINICADGSTSTYFKINVSNTANLGFKIVDENDMPLTDINKFGRINSTYTFGNNVEASYTHPDYVENGDVYRRLYLKVTYGTGFINGIKFPINIYRAPLLCVHGLWGYPSTFDVLKTKLVIDNNRLYPNNSFLFKAIMYDNNGSFSSNQMVLATKIEEMLRDLISGKDGNKYSVSKVDVVAHSMGGLISRIYIQNPYGGNPYRNDIHKLITVNTPHSGSPLADIGINICNTSTTLAFTNWIFNEVAVACNTTLLLNPAIADLRVNSQSIDQILNGYSVSRTRDVPTFAIVTKDNVFLGNLIFGNFEHDNVVPVISQQGGINPRSEPFPNIAHIGSTEKEEVIALIKEKINSPVSNLNFDLDGYVPVDLQYPIQRPIRNNLENTNEIHIISPINRSNYNPGDTVTILAQASTETKNISIKIGNQTLPVTSYDTTGNSALYKYLIPDQAIGEIRVIAFGIDSLGYNVFDTLRLNINQQAVLDSLVIEPSTIEVPEYQKAYYTVSGYFNDGVIRDLSYYSNLGIHISDTSVATFYNKNEIIGKSSGTTSLSLSLNNQTKVINVNVTDGDKYLKAGFVVNKNILCTGEEVSFTNYSFGKPDSLLWTFDSGFPSLSKAESPIVSYATSGDFSVSLIAYYNSKNDTLHIGNYISVKQKNITTKSGFWNNPETWSCQTIPSQNDSAVIATGDTIILDAPVHIKRLNIEPGGLLLINDSAFTLEIGDNINKTSELLIDGGLNIKNGVLKINGSLTLNKESSFKMSGGMLVIDGNTGGVNTSLSNGQNLININACVNSFEFTGGTLLIPNPPLGDNSQAINCPHNFGPSSTLILGNGISTLNTNNLNGFGGDMMPDKLGKLILNSGNVIFKNLKPLTIVSNCEVISGNFIQNSKVDIIDSFYQNVVLDSEGNEYHVVKIGTQFWLQENLKVTKFNNGDSITYSVDSLIINFQTPAYSNNQNSVETIKFGRNYNWFAISDPRGLCPNGWHVASDSDWMILESYLGMPTNELDSFTFHRGNEQNVGGKLKSLCSWAYPNLGAVGVSGFNALPLNNDTSNGFSSMWTSSFTDNSSGIIRRVDSYSRGVDKLNQQREVANQCRCVKN